MWSVILIVHMYRLDMSLIHYRRSLPYPNSSRASGTARNSRRTVRRVSDWPVTWQVLRTPIEAATFGSLASVDSVFYAYLIVLPDIIILYCIKKAVKLLNCC